MASIVGASISYRLAFGPNAGKKALTLQTLPAVFESGNHDDQVSNRAGFSLHAGIVCKAGQRKKLDRPGGVPLCRYVMRPLDQAAALHNRSPPTNQHGIFDQASILI